jgi:D-alanyl-D-alanine carboxypeptidase (penicillin-binding protein 5/6)
MEREPARPGRLKAALLAAVLATIVALPLAAGAQTRTPPPTPVPVPGGGTSPSPFPTALHTPVPGPSAPDVRALSAVLADLDSGEVLWADQADQHRPVASLTKLMTALLVLEAESPSEVVTVSPGAAAPGQTPGASELGLEPGERISVLNLLYALLLQSSNDAAAVLAGYVAGSQGSFVAEMNARAHRLGMRDTRFASPTGLNDAGYSSARDLARLTRAAFEHPLFGTIVGTEFRTIPAPSGPPRVIENRNSLLWLYPGALGVKTGYTAAAGFCVVAAAERDGLRLVAVVLGEAGEPFSDAAALLNYGFAGFERRDLVTAGEPFGTVMIGGRAVSVSAASAWSGLVPTEGNVRRTVLARPGVSFPPAVGEPVGRIALTAPGLELGSVPVVVSRVPGPPSPQAGPWWRRAGAAVVHAVASALSALF